MKILSVKKAINLTYVNNNAVSYNPMDTIFVRLSGGDFKLTGNISQSKSSLSFCLDAHNSFLDLITRKRKFNVWLKVKTSSSKNTMGTFLDAYLNQMCNCECDVIKTESLDHQIEELEKEDFPSLLGSFTPSNTNSDFSLDSVFGLDASSILWKLNPDADSLCEVIAQQMAKQKENISTEMLETCQDCTFVSLSSSAVFIFFLFLVTITM